MQQTGKTKKGFNRLAPYYDTCVHLLFGQALEKAQLHFLNKDILYNKILILGGGTGFLLPVLLRKNPGAQICYLDISSAMISKARARVEKEFPQGSGQIDFICGSYSDLHSGFRAELIITPFVLDCFPKDELEIVIQTLSLNLIPGGKWLFVDFVKPVSILPRIFSFLLIRPLYAVFNLISGLGLKKLPDYAVIFNTYGFKLRAEAAYCASLVKARMYER
ncbi:MAG: class I SAM-dependent methyltransferase [Bacteroidia bacterium]